MEPAAHRRGPDATSAARWGPFAWLAWRWLRRRSVAVIPIVIVVAATVAGTVAVIGAAVHTSTAFDEHLDRANTGHLQLNASLNTTDLDRFIRSLPEVERATTHALFAAGGTEPAPRGAQLELDPADPLALAQVWGSADGRFADMDRPVVLAGRMATGPNEAVIDDGFADASGLRIGDHVELGFWESIVSDPSRIFGIDLAGAEAYLSEVVEPLGVERLEIVGRVALADQVLTDELFGKRRMIVSPDVARRYDCSGAEPAAGARWAEAVDALVPKGCAVNYRYHSLTIAGGCAKCVLEAVGDEMAERNRALRNVVDADEIDASRAAAGLEPLIRPSYFLIPTETEREAARVAQAVRPTVASLWALGLGAAAIGVVLVALLIAREMRRSERDVRAWQQLGVATRTRAAVLAAPVAAALTAGAIVGLAVAWTWNPGPVGVVEMLGSAPGTRIATAGVGVAVGALALCGAATAGASVRAARRSSAATTPFAPRRYAAVPVPVGEGIRAAYGHRVAAPTIAGLAVVTAAAISIGTFATSLTSLLASGSAYGWPWDVAALASAGYGGLDLDRAAALRSDPAVESVTVLGLSNDVSLGPDPTTTVIQVGSDSAAVTLLEGRLPTGADEVALGATTASQRGLRLGDPVEMRLPRGVGGASESVTATLTGLVVFPVLGQLDAEHVSLGVGVLLPEAAVGAELAEYTATFVGVELSEAGRRDGTRRRLTEGLRSSGPDGAVVYTSPVRPSQIVGAASTRSVPLVLTAVVSVVFVAGLAAATRASARARRRDLAVFRALGFDRRQVRWTIHVQALATAAAALLLGVPVGLIGGRALWRAFAEEVGAVPDPTGGGMLAAVAVAGGLLVALLVAVVPARAAARTAPAAALSAEQ